MFLLIGHNNYPPLSFKYIISIIRLGKLQHTEVAIYPYQTVLYDLEYIHLLHM